MFAVSCNGLAYLPSAILHTLSVLGHLGSAAVFAAVVIDVADLLFDVSF
jgi:hypothetical protein